MVDGVKGFAEFQVTYFFCSWLPSRRVISSRKQMRLVERDFFSTNPCCWAISDPGKLCGLI